MLMVLTSFGYRGKRVERLFINAAALPGYDRSPLPMIHCNRCADAFPVLSKTSPRAVR
jgi:hypothetical protein